MGVMNVFKKKTSEERLEELEAKRKKEEVNIEQYNALENKWWPTIRQNTLFLMEGTFLKIFVNRMEFSFFESPLVAVFCCKDFEPFDLSRDHRRL